MPPNKRMLWSGNYAFVSEGGGTAQFTIVISRLHPTSCGDNLPRYQNERAAVAGNYLMSVRAPGLAFLIFLLFPLPGLKSTFSTSTLASPYLISVSGNYIYLIDGYGPYYLDKINISSPTNPVWSGRSLSLGSAKTPQDLYVSGIMPTCPIS